MSKGQKFFCFVAATLLVIAICVSCSFAQTRDSIVARTVTKTVSVTHDSTYSYVTYDTIKIPVSVMRKGFYDNDMSSYLGISSKEDAQINWHVKNGDNSVAGYGFGDRITDKTKWPVIANYLKKGKRKGISFGFVYSSTATLASLDAYQKAQTSDSTKFAFIVSEIEPYNSGDYAGFYKTIRAFSDWAKKQSPKVERCIYMGWPSAECWDSIITNSDKTYLHCYIQSASMTGSGIRGYTKSRTTTIANIVNAKYPAGVKYNLVIIFSCETTFSNTYFKTNSWDKPLTDFQNYFNLNATTTEKNRLTISGRQIFKSSIALILKP